MVGDAQRKAAADQIRSALKDASTLLVAIAALAGLALGVAAVALAMAGRAVRAPRLT